MRLNKYIAQATGYSRRTADGMISAGRVQVNGAPATLGHSVDSTDLVSLDGKVIELATSATTTIMLNKPVGYICSRDGQGGHTVYDLLPPEYQSLKPVGRLDKNSSGLLLLTNDGQHAYELTHPKFNKSKTYKIALNKPLSESDYQAIHEQGVMLEDGPSQLTLERINKTDDTNWKVTMSEGRNRQIRRTFEACDYNVVKLHRTQHGPYALGTLKVGTFAACDPPTSDV